MIIERSEVYKSIQCLAVILIFLCEIIFIIEFGDILFILIMFIPLYIGTLSNAIVQGRTFIIDEEGCTVYFGKFQKKYKWEEFKTKRIEKHNIPSMGRGYSNYPYLEDIIFCPKLIHKPKIMRADFYSILHPFSCIFFHFAPEEDSKLVRYYEVNKEEFLSKMEQWGVNLDIVNP